MHFSCSYTNLDHKVVSKTSASYNLSREKAHRFISSVCITLLEFNASIVNTHAVAAMLPQKARIELSLVSSSRAKLDVSVGMLKVLYAAYTFYSKKHC